MEEKKLNAENLRKAGGGFPNGELPPGVNVCPRCGEPQNLTLAGEKVLDTFGSASIDAFVPDMTVREYVCGACGLTFKRYGNFYEIPREE